MIYKELEKKELETKKLLNMVLSVHPCLYQVARSLGTAVVAKGKGHREKLLVAFSENEDLDQGKEYFSADESKFDLATIDIIDNSGFDLLHLYRMTHHFTKTASGLFSDEKLEINIGDTVELRLLPRIHRLLMNSRYYLFQSSRPDEILNFRKGLQCLILIEYFRELLEDATIEENNKIARALTDNISCETLLTRDIIHLIIDKCPVLAGSLLVNPKKLGKIMIPTKYLISNEDWFVNRLLVIGGYKFQNIPNSFPYKNCTKDSYLLARCSEHIEKIF